MRQPDIILLILDTQRADRLSCYGYPRPTSPNLDAIAAQGTRFERAISPAQWTIPSHASMFTGAYPCVHQTVQSYSVLPATLPTLAERLRAGGYYTAAFCNNPLVGVINNGLRRGFDSFLNYSGLLTSHPNQASASGNLLDRYRQGFKKVLAHLLAKTQDTFARSELMLSLSFTPLMVPLWQTALSFKGNTAKSLDDAARLLCDRRDTEDKPIFTFINLMGTHMPYRAPRRFLEKFAPHVLADPHSQRFLRQFNSDIYGWLAPLAQPLSDRDKATLDGTYDAEVANQDEQIGIFWQRLQTSGALENTLVAICADHGEHLGEKQLVGHTNALYNELTHVPLILRDSSGAFPAGTVREEVASTRRLFHTALAAARLADPEEDALSLAYPQSDRAVFAEGIPPQNVVNLLLERQPQLVRDRACDLTSLAVWSNTLKLQAKVDLDTLEAVNSDRLELYDIFNDPGETLNLRDVFPEEVERLQDCLLAFNRSVAPVATAKRASNYDDPEVTRRLRDLGYLE